MTREGTAIVPLHREVAPGTLRSILRLAALSVDEFVKLDLIAQIASGLTITSASERFA